MQKENRQLQRKLLEFIQQARLNERKHKRFQAQELRLLAVDSLVDLIKVLLKDFQVDFDLDAVSLWLVDGEHEFRRILEEQGVDLTVYPGLVFLDDDKELVQLLGGKPKALLGHYTARQHSNFFRSAGLRPQSVAMLPLVRHERLVGCMCLGSLNSARFTKYVATDFLAHLAMVAAVALENASNYEIIKRHGMIDFLTGVNNRRAFDQRLKEEVMRASRKKEVLACLFLDVDFFKKVNDNYGHEVGDVALQEVSKVIKQQLRASDVLARYGGEEFAALLPHTNEDVACDIAERIRLAVERNRIRLGSGEELAITLSVGVAAVTPDGSNQDAVQLISSALVDTADKALYQAKGSGRNQVVCASLLL